MRLAAIFVIAITAEICLAAVSPMEQDTLKSYLENGAPFDFILIDVRTSSEISTAIGNTLCKPYNLAWPAQFKQECTNIPKDRTIIIYCQGGGRAASAATYLETKGYASVYNAGGLMTWTGPTVPSSEIKAASLLPEPSMRAKTGRNYFRRILEAESAFMAGIRPLPILGQAPSSDGSRAR